MTLPDQKIQDWLIVSGRAETAFRSVTISRFGVMGF